MKVLFRRQRQQEGHPQHDRIAVFIGEQHELKHSGELIFSDEEWHKFMHWGLLVEDPEIGVEIVVEDRMGSPAP